MANLKQAKTEEDIKQMTLAKVKKAYIELANDYNKIIEGDYILCPSCNSFITRNNFYSSNSYSLGVFPICKKCLLEKAEQRTRRTDTPNETKESVQRVLQMMDLPYIDSLYESCVKSVNDEANEKNRKAPFLQMITILQSLPNYRGLTWKDSDFGDNNVENVSEDEIEIIQETLKNAKKRFGSGYSDEDLMFLENEYQDWITRYECNTKAQETIFERLAFKKWEINKATKSNQSTKDLDKTYTELLSSINILPRQNSANGIMNSLSFGQMIEQWEEHDPVFEPEPEFADCDGIGKYLRVWFKGHLARALGLDNGYSREYDEYIKQYTVTKPEYNEDGTSEDIYQTLFGSEGE